MTSPHSPIVPDDVERLARMMRAYGETWSNRHRDIADDFNKTATLLEQLQASNAALVEALTGIANAIRIGSQTDVLSWKSLADACQTTARAALERNAR